MVSKLSDGMSIIVPFLNEEDGILLFCKKIDEFSASLLFDIELVFVNDGSIDKTENLIREYPFLNVKKVKIIAFSRNFGSHAAIRAGLTKATNSICTWIGCDLQEPLELLEISFEKISKEGYDAVYIEKKSVDVTKSNRMFSKMYSLLMKKFAVPNYSSYGVSTIVFNSKIKNHLNQHIEANSSIMLQIMSAGFNYDSIALDFNKRSAGVSKWTLSKKIKLFIDSFVSFSYMPIRLVSIIGIIIFLLGFIIGIVTIVNSIVNPFVPLGYSTLASIMALGFGITNISLGIIAEYLWRAYDTSRNRPVFIISDEIQVKGYDE